MKKKLQFIITSLAIALGVMATPLVPADTASAGTCTGTGCLKDGANATTPPGQQRRAGLNERVKIITNILMFALGLICVIVIIIGGIRYTTSNGEQAQLTAAKNTILYALVGLVLAILAYAIVNFVVDAFVPAATP